MKPTTVQRKRWNATYKRKHPERVVASKRKYREANRELLNQKNREYYVTHKVEKKACTASYYKKNKDKIKRRNAQWKKNNPKCKAAHYLKWYRKKYATDPIFRLRVNLQTRLGLALRENTKSDSMRQLVGCNIKQLKQHLEVQFTEGMTWDNYGKWHVDHIRPCILFDFSDPKQQRKCFNYKNLQPLWAIDNLRKGIKCA